MGSLDPAKLLVVLVIAFVVIGPERLPAAARQLGRAWHQLTRVREEVLDEVRSALPSDLPSIPRPGRTVSSFLSDLTAPASPRAATARSAPQQAIERVGTPSPEPSITFDDPSLN